MMPVLAVAQNTFREAIRNRIMASLVLFAVGMMLLTLAVSSASLHEEVRLMKDIGLFLISGFSVLIAIFVGVNLLLLEIQRKTIYTVMPKPIHRHEFLLGKYLGLAATMAVQVLVMGGVLALQFVFLGADFGVEMVQAMWLIYVEVLIIISVAMVFSSFSTPFLSGLLAFGVFAVGRFVDRLGTLTLTKRGESDPALDQIAAIVRTATRVLPDLSLYNATPHVVHEASMAGAHVGNATLYGLSYAAAALLIASLIFSRRDFI